MAAGVVARAEKPFYDSKSMIVNVTGSGALLFNYCGFESKLNFVNVPIPYGFPQKLDKKECQRLAADMTLSGVGRRYINALTDNGRDDYKLRRMALVNANRRDEEYASEHVRGIDDEQIQNLLAEDYEPVLRNNYIVLAREIPQKDGKMKYEYAIFWVEVTEQQSYDIAMSLGTGAMPDDNYPVKFLCSGTYDPKKPWKTRNQISKNAPGLAVRGVITRRNPGCISIGEDVGLRKGDLVSVYSQRMDKNGKKYSKRISRARVCGLWKNEAQINFEDRMAGNRKNGDVVVITPDNLHRWGLAAQYTPHVFGGEIRFDQKVGFARSGLISHLLFNIGGGVTDKPDAKFCVVDDKHDDYVYNAPFFINGGIGYGLSKTFFGSFDVMPFVVAQYEAGIMTDFDGVVNDFNKFTNTGNGSTEGAAQLPSMHSLLWGHSLRLPLGVRCSLNIGYPVRIYLEAGYAFRFGLGRNAKFVESSCDYLGAKRGGVFASLGFSF